MKKLLVLSVIFLTGCSSISTRQSNIEVNEEYSSVQETESVVVEELSEAEEISSEIEVETQVNTNNIISIEYFDDACPSSTFKFKINRETRELNIDVFHFSTAIDVGSANNIKTVVVEDDEVFNLILKAYDRGVLDSGWAYSYCSMLEGIENVLGDTVVATSDDVMWDMMYSEDDTNSDGVLKAREEFISVFDLMLSDL